MDSALPCTGFTEADRNQLSPAWGSPWLPPTDINHAAPQLPNLATHTQYIYLLTNRLFWYMILEHSVHQTPTVRSTTSLGSLFQGLTTLTVKKMFLTSSLNLPGTALSHSHTSWHRCPPQNVAERNGVMPQPPFLQTRQPKCPQPLLTGRALQPFYIYSQCTDCNRELEETFI